MTPRSFTKSPAKKCVRGESSSTIPTPSLANCFKENDTLEKFNTYFATQNVQISRPLDLNFVSNQLEFKYLNQLRDCGWLPCLQIRCVFYENLVRAFYSNAKFIYGFNG
ncbi:hypothetical protein ERO13_D01G146550v2 [Gossypium hirsutum]|nr:hypothetical protein ERO13_D01G146550v2 [Gossypium hirsutum]